MLVHVLAGALAPPLVRRWGARAFWALAAAPTAATAWAVAQRGEAYGGGRLESMAWVPTLGLDLSFALTPLTWIMTLVVGGVGAAVLAYCAWYFPDDEPGLGLLAANLVWFAGAMLALVWSDDLLLLYVAWEVTTVLSYLLVGHDPTKRAARSAALQALLVTTLGGLAMLGGILLLGVQQGTFSASALLADPPAATGTTIAAAILVLLGAVTKSALVPFHFWLPGAMAAPTPVSAYLHAAAMVKAGVFLVLLLAPALADVPGWRQVLLLLGSVTMLLGAYRALRQLDLKLLLAYGTVSQLGFLLLLAGAGTRSAALAALGLLVAHALFKATLFLVVGVVDRRTGTRDVRELSGLRRRLPGLAVVAALGAASMAGLPPLLGFVGKESAFAALWDLAVDGDGTGMPRWIGGAALAAAVLGSTLTVAYSARFWFGAFADRPGCAPTVIRAVPGRTGFAVPAVLGALGLLLAPAGPVLTDLVQPYAEQFPPGAHDPYLALWHGLEPALGFSLLAIGGGLLLFWRREHVATAQAALASDLSAERAYQATVRGLDRAAVEVTGFVQRGSLSVYLAVVLVVLVLLPGGVLLTRTGLAQPLVWWDTPAQLVVGVLAVAACILAARSRRRLRAVILLGASGYAVGAIFLLHGATDLAITQILVETVTVVVFVLVLRRLPEHFSDRPLSRSRYWRMALSGVAAATVAGFLLVATGSRVDEPISRDLPREAVDFGGGYNVVNVILVDARAWDTFGEVAVLVVAATGVASLLFVETRVAGIRRVADIPYPAGVEKLRVGAGRRAWLPGPRTLSPERRSILFEVVTRLLFHTVVVLSLFLLLAGHNNPGGGFAGGLVAGLALMVRYLAGGRYELDEAAPLDAGLVLGLGLFLAGLSALLPLFFGAAALQSLVVEVVVPVLGTVKIVTALLFDVGVYLIVLGLVLDLLRSLGSSIDRQVRREEREHGDDALAMPRGGGLT